MSAALLPCWVWPGYEANLYVIRLVSLHPQIKVDEEGKIVDAKFKTFGCGSAIASSSLATEWIKGKSVSCATVQPCGHRLTTVHEF